MNQMRKTLTVSELNHIVARCLDQEPELQLISVEGEISSAKRYPSGHFYFTLKDQKASVSAVMFASDVRRQPQLPKDGDQVICRGRATLYETGGRYQLQTFDFENVGAGVLWFQYLKLKKELEEKGWFCQEIKKELPFIPRCVGVVTSEKGAVIHDIIQVARRRFPGFCLKLISVHVQGNLAAGEIAAAIRHFNETKSADVLIVGRGGGSMEDLAAFNDLRVATAVHDSEIPVISAVGHESDVTICDFCADLRAPTPSAAAELCWPSKADLEKRLGTAAERLRAAEWRYYSEKIKSFRRARTALKPALLRILHEQMLRLDQLLQRPSFSQPERIFAARELELKNLRQRLSQSMLFLREKERGNLKHQTALLNACNPWRPLQAGFAAAETERGELITSIFQLTPGQDMRLLFSDGSAAVRVLSCEANPDYQKL